MIPVLNAIFASTFATGQIERQLRPEDPQEEPQEVVFQEEVGEQGPKESPRRDQVQRQALHRNNQVMDNRALTRFRVLGAPITPILYQIIRL